MTPIETSHWSITVSSKLLNLKVLNAKTLFIGITGCIGANSYLCSSQDPVCQSDMKLKADNETSPPHHFGYFSIIALWVNLEKNEA